MARPGPSRASTCACARANRSRSWAPRAPARPPCCTASRVSCRPTPARCRSSRAPAASTSPRSRAEEYARGWLAALGLAGMEDRRIGQLSGGQAQRVAIARAQVTGAPVVFADEPTGALDSATSAEVMQALLDSTTGQGRTLVVVTHDADVAGRCSRIVDMRDGRIVGERVPAG